MTPLPDPQSVLIALETCTPVGGVCLSCADGRLNECVVVDSPRAQSVEIAEAVKRLMHVHSVQWEHVTAVAVSTGPGSFTGVRLGLSLAKALCLTGSPKLVEVSTLHATALRSLPLLKEGQRIVPLFNAKKGEVYGQFFTRSENRLIPESEPFAASINEFPHLFKQVRNSLFTGVGSLDYHKELLDSALNCTFSSLDVLHPHPLTVAQLGWEAVQRNEFSDPSTATPFYLREASVSTPKKQLL